MFSPRRSFGVTSLHFFVFGLMMALGFGTVLAVPTATPPSGAVTPNFTNVNVSGTTTTNDLNATGTLTSTGNISINNDLLETQAINSVDYLTVGYSGTSDTQYASMSRTGKIGSIVSNEDYGAYVWNNTTQAAKSAIKGRIGSSTATVDGYLGYIDSTGTYGLYTPANAKVVGNTTVGGNGSFGGTLAVTGATTLNGAISSSTGALNLNDATTITGNATISGNTSVGGSISSSAAALVLSDDVQIGAATMLLGVTAKLFTGAISNLTYATHAEFGNYDLASSDDLFADDKIFAGSNITAGGDITSGDDITAGDDLVVTDDINTGGSITASSIGAFYSVFGSINMDTGMSTLVAAVKNCLEGDVVIACSGRIEQSGAFYGGSKPVTGNCDTVSGSSASNQPGVCIPPYSTQGCQAWGARGTASSGTDLNVYTFCFSPNG